MPEQGLRFLQAQSARLRGQIEVPRPWHYAELHNPWARAAAAYDSWGFLDLCQCSSLIETVATLIGTDIILFDSEWLPERAQSGRTASALERDAQSGRTASALERDAQSGCAASAPESDAQSGCAASALESDAQSGCAASAPESDAQSGCAASAPESDAQSACAALAPESDAHRFPVAPLRGLTALICFADVHAGTVRVDYRPRDRSAGDSEADVSLDLKCGDLLFVDCGVPYRVFPALENSLPAVYAIRYFPASSRYNRDPAAPVHRALTERYPLFNYARMPLWLVQGQDLSGNDFVTGFDVRAGFWTSAKW